MIRSVVHVMAIGSAEDRLSLETLLAGPSTISAMKRREFVFQCDMASLLVGNITSQCVEVLAGRLLRGLTSFDEQESRRAIVFVAYDFGDLIVKKVCAECSRTR
jgi:hypothetical protein